MISEFQCNALKIRIDSNLGLNELIRKLKISKLNYSQINALTELVKKKYVKETIEKEKFIVMNDFIDKYSIVNSFKQDTSELLQKWEDMKYVTNNLGIIEVEEYFRVELRDKRDKVKIKQTFNRNAIAYLATIISIASLWIAILK